VYAQIRVDFKNQRMPMKSFDPWHYERRAFERGYRRVAGIDEAGRGPLAGPVVSAAVILPADLDLSEINDSKQLAPAKRARLYDAIYDCAVSIGLGIVDAMYIDRLNILKASLLSMAISAANLKPLPDCLLIDGQFEVPSELPQQAIPKGDALSISIGAASIVAKVTRDRLMERYSLDYPQYGFNQHKGYPTQAHRAAIRKHGCCPIHRRSFKGVKEYVTSVSRSAR
jgi:ribonuclease HII